MGAEAEVRQERVRVMFRQTPIAVVVTVLIAALMAAVLVDVEHQRHAYAWLAAVVCVAALRLALWSAYRSGSTGPERVRSWAIAGVSGAAVAGLLWGGGAFLLWPQPETYQLLWVFLIGGMCAGAAALHYAYLPTVLAFIVPAALPIAARFAAIGSEQHVVAAGMIGVFLAALGVIAWRSSRDFGDALRLQFALAERTVELDAANARLRAEMAEHRATEASLRQAQKVEAIGKLTGGIAHDFNNLLTVVLGSLALLRKHLALADPGAIRLLDNAVQGAERGAALTQRLLAFGRRQTLRTEIVELSALVRGISDLLRSSLGADIRVQMRFPPILAPVRADAGQLELVLLNLAANARDAMPAGGTITIMGREERVVPGGAGGLAAGAYVVLAVADTGEGMDEATLAQAIEPFFTTKGVGKGTGLGLSMVQGLAEQSGGRFLLHSRKGEGTVAELWLPRAEAPRAAPAQRPAPLRRLATRHRTVLVVDDDPLVLASTAAMLEDLGHVAIEAASGRQALDVLRRGAKVDIVVTDHTMPGMTGLQLADELRRLRPALPVLLASGYAELEGAAALPRLAKPFGQAALTEAIERADSAVSHA